MDAQGYRRAQQGVDRIVGTALLRRSITAFVGIRELLTDSLVQPALVLMRSHFETFLSLRYLIHGSRRRLWLTSPSSPQMRERRARYFMASSIRTGIYRMQAVLDGRSGARRPSRATREAIEQGTRRRTGSASGKLRGAECAIRPAEMLCNKTRPAQVLRRPNVVLLRIPCWEGEYCECARNTLRIWW